MATQIHLKPIKIQQNINKNYPFYIPNLHTLQAN
jgi:hypothetical protein